MRKLVLVLLLVGALLILAGCDDSDPADKPTTTPIPSTPTAESTALPLQATLIITVEAPGDLAAESLLLENRGPMLNLTGWQIVSPDGQTFTFPEYRVMQGTTLAVFSRTGSNTPLGFYWGSSTALWSPGAIVTLQDAAGQSQAQVIVGE